MNKEEIEKDIKFTASIPMLTQEEINGIDLNMNEIINQFTKIVVKEKDLVIAQYIVKRQEDKIKELQQKESILDKVTEECRKQMTTYEDSILEIFPGKLLNIIEGEKK